MSTREAQTPTNGENLSRTSYRKYSNYSVETNPHSTKNKLQQMFSSTQTTYQIRSISTGMIEMQTKRRHPHWDISFLLSLLSDSNQRPRDYKSRALAS